MIQFKENAQTDGRTDGQTLFYRTLLATAGGPKSDSRTPSLQNTSVRLFLLMKPTPGM